MLTYFTSEFPTFIKSLARTCSNPPFYDTEPALRLSYSAKKKRNKLLQETADKNMDKFNRQTHKRQ